MFSPWFFAGRLRPSVQPPLARAFPGPGKFTTRQIASVSRPFSAPSAAVPPQRTLLLRAFPPLRSARLFRFQPARSPVQILSRRCLSNTPRQKYSYDPNDPRIRHARPLFADNALKRRLRAPSTHAVVVLAIVGALVFYFSNLETVPISGRRRFNCFSDELVRKIAEMQYTRLLRDIEHQGGRMLPSWDWRDRIVRRVMAKLIPVSGMADDGWEVHVIDDPGTANAFVLPGGKVFVFSGIFRFARSEDALAAVLGHEIAHNLAGHVAERMSQSIATNLIYYNVLLLSASVAAFLAAHLYGDILLTTLFESPMSRLQESEADYIGLMMMAEACYDPQEAVGFWKRMDHAHGDEQPPEWMSTHPSNQSRIESIQKWMPKAQDKRAESSCHGTQGFAELFKRALRRGEIIVV